MTFCQIRVDRALALRRVVNARKVVIASSAAFRLE